MKMGQQPTEPTHLAGVHFSNKWLKLCTYIPLTELRWISVGRSTWPTCIILLPFKKISLKLPTNSPRTITDLFRLLLVFGVSAHYFLTIVAVD